jgi:DDE superfamily endonuclease
MGFRRPRDLDRPLVCLDETSKQLIVETRTPIPAKPGRAAWHDYEYERNGVANLFMIFAPLEGWRQVKVTDRHAAVDYADVFKELSDVHFPGAEQIRLVQDNLSTHTPASLYAAFPAAEARRLVKRFEWHYTPKHGSWLDSRIRTRRFVEPMFEPPHSRQADPAKRGRRLAGPSQQASHQGRLTIYHRRCPREAQEALPLILSDSGD